MDKSMRLTTQMQQERISRNQLCERLIEFGWAPTAPSQDLGEDFIVHIYFQGQATGVTFHIQEKSVTNLYERHKGDYLVYDLEVKDLKHWASFDLPVVLIVWDIKLREGRWALISDVISDLDQRLPHWRTNKSTARVYLSWDNTTDNTGLVKLKQSIGRHVYPLITGDKSLEIQMTLNFPDTEEGGVAWQAFEQFRKEGEPVTFRGRIIQELKFSQWWMRWFGEYDPDNVQVTIGPLASPKTFVVDIDIISATGETASISNVELKMIKVGEEMVQLTNDHQALSLHFHFTLPDPKKYKEASISYSLNDIGHNVHKTREIIRFLRATTTGGTLRLTFRNYDYDPLMMTLPPQPEKIRDHEHLQLVNDSEYLNLIDKLCMIQDKTGYFLKVPDDGLTNTDIRAINELIEIIEHGRTRPKVKDVTWEFKQPALDLILDVHRHDKPSHFVVTYPESHVELFDLKIETGRMTRHITGRLKVSVTELEQTIATLASDEYLPLKFIDVEVVEVFPAWFEREAQRLSRLMVEKFGVEAVYLFGSLVWSDVHAPETDIDLAVTGLPAERYLEVMGYLERESTFSIDLVELSRVPDHLRQRILTEGKLLNESTPVMALG